MDFDNDSGLINTESLLQLLEIERQANRAHHASQHNVDVSNIRSIAEHIASHCLCAVAKDRSLLLQEGALNSSIFNFLIESGYPIIKGDSRQRDWKYRTDEEGKIVANQIPRTVRKTGVTPDFLMYDDRNRLELKTAAYASSKDKIPSEFFYKDLRHLQRQELEDLETYPWEGVPRTHRNAEIAILVCDLSIAQSSEGIGQLFGQIPDIGKNAVKGREGVTYTFDVGTYETNFNVQPSSENLISIQRFIVLTAYPSRQDGA